MEILNFFILFFLGFFIAKFNLHIKIFIFIKYEILFRFLSLFSSSKKLNLVRLRNEIDIDNEYKSLELFLKRKNKKKNKISRNNLAQSISEENIIKNSLINKNRKIKIIF